VSIAKPVSITTRLSAGSFANIINSDVANERVFLNIGFAQLPPSSDFAVRVFINFPGANSTTPVDDLHFAGSFAFFGTPEPAAPTATGVEHQRPDFLVNITDTLRTLRRTQELTDTAPLSVQLVAVPFAAGFERPDTTLLLEKIDVITTPVIINSRQ
jgi:tyrosinase